MNQSWLRQKLQAWQAQLAKYPARRQIVGNAAWLLSDRVLRLGVGLIVGVWVARYLGPVQFGLLSN
jgi:polysaccharide transporter, PST family